MLTGIQKLHKTVKKKKKSNLTRNVLSSVGDVNVIEAGGEGNILNAAASIFVVFARHL